MSVRTARLIREIKFPPGLVVLGTPPDTARFLQVALKGVHTRIRLAAATVKRMIVVPMSEVSGAQAGDGGVGRGHAAADDSGEVLRVVLLQVAPEVAHAPLRLDVPAFLAPNEGFDVGVIGSVIGGSSVVRVGHRLVTSTALGLQRLRGWIDGPECPLHGGRRNGAR
jgi:hypothetical protein